MEERFTDHEKRLSLVEKIADRHEATLKNHEAKIDKIATDNSIQDTSIKLFQKDLDFIKEQLKTMNATLIEISDKPKKAFDKYKDTIITIVLTAIVTGIIAKLVKGW